MHVDRLSSACANLSYLELLGQWGRSGWTDHVTDGVRYLFRFVCPGMNLKLSMVKYLCKLYIVCR